MSSHDKVPCDLLLDRPMSGFLGAYLSNVDISYVELGTDLRSTYADWSRALGNQSGIVVALQIAKSVERLIGPRGCLLIYRLDEISPGQVVMILEEARTRGFLRPHLFS